MVWAIDFDDESVSMLKSIDLQDICLNFNDSNKNKYSCSLLNEKRWWSFEDDLNLTNNSQKRAGMCGKSAPLYNGYYPICDPSDPGYSCCNGFGYCCCLVRVFVAAGSVGVASDLLGHINWLCSVFLHYIAWLASCW